MIAGVGEAYAELLLAETLARVGRALRSEIRSVVTIRSRCELAAGEELLLDIEYNGNPIAEDLIASLPRREGVIVEGRERSSLACVRIRFPLGDASSKAALVDTAACERPKLALLAEDEGVLRFAIGSMLEALDYDVALAEDGALALDQFFERPDDFSLALVDLHMPVIDGHSVVESIRSRRPDLPILKMSGDDGDSVGESFGGEESQCCFLSKPFGASELRQAIASVAPDRASTARPT